MQLNWEKANSIQNKKEISINLETAGIHHIIVYQINFLNSIALHGKWIFFSNIASFIWL